MEAFLECMSMTHLSMIIYDLKKLGDTDYDPYYTPAESPNILLIDNHAAMQMSKNWKPTKYNRHIDRRYHYVRQGQKEGKHKIIWIPEKIKLLMT